MSFSLPAFPVEALPERLGCFVRHAAESLSCPVDFVGVFALSVMSSAVGTARAIRLKSGWTEPAVLYTAVVAPPASKKSPAIKVALSPVHQKQMAHKYEYDQRKAEFEVEIETWESQKKKGPKPIGPVMRRNYVSDFTIEALARILQYNPKGVLLGLDEVASWMKSMDQYRKGKGSDLDKWLSMWTCSAFTVDRAAKDEPIVLERPFISVTGGIQPDRLNLFKSSNEDGFIERILFAFPEPVPDRWVEDGISPTVQKAYIDLYNQLCDLQPEIQSGTFTPQPIILDFAPEAKKQFIQYFYHNLEDINLEVDPYLKPAFKKIEAYTARFALLMQLCQNPDSLLIEPPAVASAAVLAEYFKGHARKVSAHLKGIRVNDRLLRAVMALRSHGGPMTLRECYTKKVAGCKNAASAKKLFKELAEAGYGKMVEAPNTTGGRKTYQFQLRIFDAAIGNQLL